jgi:hypothetical protein
LPAIYIGEGDPVRPRLEQHYGKKDFWTTLILFVSKDENMNKAHVQYLESKLVALAKEGKRCALDNVSVPQLPSLSEADTAEVEAFLDEMLLIYPLLSIDAFEKPQAAPASVTILYLRTKGLIAKGYDAAQGFVVLAGSQVPQDAAPSIQPYQLEIRKSLISRTVLTVTDKCLVLAQDYVFDSPSTAASVMLGRSANGRVEWKDAQGVTLRKLQESASSAQGSE